MTMRETRVVLRDVFDGGADAEGYAFQLKLKQLRELQDKCNAGPQTILQRLTNGTWRIEDVRETLRLGLIGAGMLPHEALRLIVHYLDDAPKAAHVPHAQAVMLVTLFGAASEEDLKDAEEATDSQGKTEAVESTATDDSTSPPFTDGAPLSAAP